MDTSDNIINLEVSIKSGEVQLDPISIISITTSRKIKIRNKVKKTLDKIPY